MPVTSAGSSASRLASASADLTLRLWNLDDASLIEELRPSAKEMNTLRFSPSGNRLAGCDADGVLRVWEFGEPPSSE